MTSTAAAIVLALVALFGAAGGAAGSPADALLARSDSLRAVAASRTDSVSRSGAPGDSGGPSMDPVSGGLAGAVRDSAVHKRSLPPRTLTLRQQVMFAGGFMAFVALMMTSMQNFNP